MLSLKLTVAMTYSSPSNFESARLEKRNCREHWQVRLKVRDENRARAFFNAFTRNARTRLHAFGLEKFDL